MDIAECAGHPQASKQTRLTERHSQLPTNDAEATILTFPGAPGLPRAAEPVEGGSTPGRAGFLPDSITLRATGTDTELAVYTPNTWSAGGTLAFPNGCTIRVTTRQR